MSGLWLTIGVVLLATIMVVITIRILARNKSQFLAEIMNNLMPVGWIPQGIFRYMWQYRFVRHKRGRRLCAQTGESERYTELTSWDNIEVAGRMGGRTYPRLVFRRPPVIAEDTLRKLRLLGCIGILIRENGQVVFMGVGGKEMPDGVFVSSVLSGKRCTTGPSTSFSHF